MASNEEQRLFTLKPPIENDCRYLNSVCDCLPCLMMLQNMCNPLPWKKCCLCVVLLEDLYSRSMFVARVEQSILTDGQTAWQQPSDLQWTPLCLFRSILNDEKIVCILSHLRIQIYSNLRNPTHSAFVFSFGFPKKRPKQQRTFICLFLVYLKNNITVDTSQLFNNCFLTELLNVPPLISCQFLKITLCATGDIHM